MEVDRATAHMHVEFANAAIIRQALGIFNKNFMVLYFTKTTIWSWDPNAITDVMALVAIDHTSASTYHLNLPEGAEDLMLRVSGRTLCTWLKTLDATTVLSIRHAYGSDSVEFTSTGGRTTRYVSNLTATVMDNERSERMLELDAINQASRQFDVQFAISPQYLTNSLKPMSRFVNVVVERRSEGDHHVDKLTFWSREGSDTKRQWIESRTPRDGAVATDRDGGVDVPRFVPHTSRNRGVKSDDFDFRIYGSASDDAPVSGEIVMQKSALKFASEKFESVGTVNVMVKTGRYMLMAASTAVGSVTLVIKHIDTGTSVAGASSWTTRAATTAPAIEPSAPPEWGSEVQSTAEVLML